MQRLLGNNGLTRMDRINGFDDAVEFVFINFGQRTQQWLLGFYFVVYDLVLDDGVWVDDWGWVVESAHFLLRIKILFNVFRRCDCILFIVLTVLSSIFGKEN